MPGSTRGGTCATSGSSSASGGRSRTWSWTAAGSGRCAPATPLGRAESVVADYYVCALPVDHARRAWNADLLAADPQLREATTLETQWLTGLMLYFDRPTPLVHGHVYYIHAPWSLNSISQAAFWPARDFPADYGDGAVADCVSVIISDRDRPDVLFGRPARQLTEGRSSRRCWPSSSSTSTTPVGSWRRRPTARTAVPDLFLAGDYVRTPINGAGMEAANGSARLAVNALLDEAGSSAPRAEVGRLYRAPEFELLKAQDQVNHRLGLPNAFDLL